MFVSTIIVSILFGLLSIIRPLLIQYAFDHYIFNYDAAGLLSIILLILLLLLCEAFFQFIFIYRSNYVAQKIINNIRSEVFQKIISFKLQYFDNVECYYKYNYFLKHCCYKYQILLKILYLVILYI